MTTPMTNSADIPPRRTLPTRTYPSCRVCQRRSKCDIYFSLILNFDDAPPGTIGDSSNFDKACFDTSRDCVDFTPASF